MHGPTFTAADDRDALHFLERMARLRVRLVSAFCAAGIALTFAALASWWLA